MIQPANPRSLSPARRSFEPIIGESVSATTPDTITAPASVNANSRNSEPVSPPWIPTGAYTAASVIVIAMIGPSSSRAASIAARCGRLPACRCRSMFSTITIASSTTRPTDSTIASSVSRLIVKPAASIRNTAPTSEIGIATTAITTERSEPRNRKITAITIRSVSVSVESTSWIASWMYSVES